MGQQTTFRCVLLQGYNYGLGTTLAGDASAHGCCGATVATCAAVQSSQLAGRQGPVSCLSCTLCSGCLRHCCTGPWSTALTTAACLPALCWQLRSLRHVAHLCLGFSHSMSIGKYGEVCSWGTDENGSLGQGFTWPRPGSRFPEPVKARLVTGAAGWKHTAGDLAVMCTQAQAGRGCSKPLANGLGWFQLHWDRDRTDNHWQCLCWMLPCHTLPLVEHSARQHVVQRTLAPHYCVSLY